MLPILLPEDQTPQKVSSPLGGGMPLLLPDTPAPVSTEAIRQNLHFTKGVAPDQVAEDHRLGQASGFAPDLVSRNRDEIRARVEANDVLAQTANSPGTQRYLSEQNNLAVSKDDIGNLAETEGWFKHYFTGPAKSLAKQAGAAPFNLGATAYEFIGGVAGAADGTERGIGNILGTGSTGAFGYIRNWAMNNAQSLADVAQKSELLSLPAPLKDKGLWDNPKLLFNPEWLTYNVGQAATSMIPQLLIAAYTNGGTLAGSAVGGLQEGGDLYRELLDNGTDPDRALAASQAFGVATTILNKIGLEAIMGKTATKNLAVRAGKAIASGSTEAVTEWLEEPFQALFGGMAQGKGPDELGADILESLKHVDVMPGAFLFGGGTAYMTQYKAEYDGVKRAEKDATLFASLDELAAGSKTRQRMPAAYEAFVNFAQEQAGGKVSDIFVDAELLQSALPAQQLTELLDKVDISKETFAESVQTGSAVVIPISKYLAHVAGTEASQAIRNDLRFSENGMSLNEAADARKNWAENMQSIIEEDRRITESNTQFDEEGQLIHDDIYTKLIDAGQSEEVATANAVAWRAFAVTAPTRYDGYYGATPAEVYQKLVPEVQAQAFADHQASRDEVTFHQEFAGQHGITVAEAQGQYDAVVAQHKEAESWLKAPNGQPTKLNERQWVQAQTPAFKEWFGGSKAVDENGEPLVVYHGTKAAPKEFSPRRVGHGSTLFGDYEVERHGIFVTPDVAVANDFADQGAGASVMPLYVKIENPIDLFEGYYDGPLFDKVEQVAAGMGLDGYRTARLLGDYWGRDNSWELFDKDAHNDPETWIKLFGLLGFDGARIYEPQVAGEGAAGETFVAFDPSQIKSSTGNTGQFDSQNPDIRYQGGEGKNLYAAHNLSEDNLRHVLELGGLAAPSLAVGNIDNSAFTAFGEITLLADPSILFSHKTKTFDADVYSPRHPQAVHVIDRGKLDKLVASFGDTHGLDIPGEGDLEESRGLDRLKRNDAFKLVWLRSQGATIPLKKVPATPAVRKIAEIPSRSRYELEQNPAVVKIAQATAEKDLAKIPEDVRDDVRGSWFTEDGKVKHSYVRDLVYKAVHLRDTGGVDQLALRQAISRKLRDPKVAAEFEEHARKTFDSLVKERKIFKGFTNSGNRRYVAYTLANIVSDMTQDLRGGEGFNYGAGSVRSAFAKQFKNLADIQKHRDRVISEEEMKTIKEESQQKLFDLLEELRPFYKYDAKSFQYMDDASQSIAEGAKGMREAFENLPAEMQTRVREFTDYLKNLPTEYFEAKMQRGVNLSEFNAAVVPKGTSDELVQALKARGLDVRFYKKGDDAARLKAVRASATLFQNPTTPQGAFTVKDGKPLIKLFETANPSTFLHETGHTFFTFMEQMAARDDAPQALKDDWQALVDYTGSKDGKLANEHHETLARALEAYFMEGKAPSPELRTVFQQFAAWLKAIYRQLSALNAPVNDEIRQVFDRMFATDTEIEQAKAYYSAKEDFLSVAQVDDTAAAEKYRKLKAKADEDAGDSRFRKYAKAYMQALGGKKALEAKARAEINALPAYVAADTAVAAGGFSADMLDALIGKEKRVQLAKRRVGLITQKGGADIDAVMAATGYENPGEMFDAILAAENKTVAIERLVKDRIAQQQETIRQDLADGPVAADSDYHSDSRMALLIAEVELINKKRSLAAGRDKGTITRLQVQAIRDAARQVLQAKSVTEATKYFQYSRAEAKAAKQAMDAFKKGDFDNAERFKRRELLNHALVLESIKAKDEVESIEGRFNRAVDRKNVDSAYHAQALRFLMVNGLTQRRIAVPENTKSFEAFMEGLRHEDADSPMAGSVPVWSEWALTGKETKGGWRKNFTLAELQEADSLVRWLIETGADIRGGRLAEYQQTLDEIVQEAIAPAASLKNKHIYGETHPMRRGSVWVRKFIADHSQLMFIFDSLDGFKAMVKKGSASFGPNRTMIGHKLTEAQDHRDRMQKEVRDKLLAPIRQLAKSAAKHGKSIPGLNIPEAMRKDGRVWTFERVVAVALNMGNPTNANRVAAGYGLVTDDEVSMAAGNLDSLTKKEMVERLQQVRTQLSLAKLTQLTSQVLTAEDWGSVQALWNTVNGYWEQLDDVHYKVNHFRREKVQARPFQAQLADGTTVAMEGGYYPLKYDRILSDQVAEWSEQDDLFNESVFGHPGVESGMIKSRVAGPVRMPVDLSLSVLFKHMEDVVHYISHAAIIKDVDRITRDATYAEVVKNKLGREAYHAIRPILRNIAKPDRAVGLHLDTMFDRMRVLASAYVLGLNTSVAAKQLFSLPSMWHDIGFGNWLRGVKHVLTNPSAAYQAMHELSPYMATRASSFDREIRDSGNAIMGKGFGMDKTRRDQLRDVAFLPIQVMDMVSVLPSWWAAYNAERTRGGDEKTAVRYADEMIRASQPTSKAVEQAKVLYTRTGMTRFFSMFMTFSVTFGNRQRYFYRGWKEGKVSTGEYAKHLALDAIVPVLLQNIVLGALWGGGDDDDENSWAGMALDVLLYQFSGEVFIRDAAGMAVSAFKNRVLEEDNFVNNLGESAVLTGFKLAERSYVSLLNVMMDLDDDEKSEKAIWAFAEIVSFWAGLPVPKLVRNIKEGMRQFEEEDGTLFNVIAPDPQKRSRNQ